MKKIFLFLFLSVALSLSAESFFKKGDRVCFVGNSITNNGEFYHNLLMYYTTRYPQMPVSFFNCGISGDVTGGILRRMDEDILINKPTHCVLMIGMNDVKRNLYREIPTTNADTLRMRAEALKVYNENLEKIVNVFLSKGIKVIMQKPTIYDQTAKIPTYNNLGVNDALKACADFGGTLSAKYKLPTVDYWTIMNRINLDVQKQDPAATILSKDRVHPYATGHLIMAYEFLKTEKASQYVSKIVLSRDEKESNRKSEGCRLSAVVIGKDRIAFKALESSLPFPLSKDQAEAAQLVPFQQEFNMQLLQVPALKEGTYDLLIDGKQIASFTAKQLSEGVNLADCPETPQMKQAMEVRKTLVTLRSTIAKTRTLKFIEYNSFFKGCADKGDVNAICDCLEATFKTKYDNPYYVNQTKSYRENKPKEKEFANRCEELRKRSYELAQPVEHEFLLVRK